MRHAIGPLLAFVSAFAIAGLSANASASDSAGNSPALGLPSSTIGDGQGVNIHFTNPRPGELEQLAAGGFRWVRMDFSWSDTEKRKGVYDFSAYDRLTAALAAQRLRPYLILDYQNALYDEGLSPRSEAGRAAFCAWTAAALDHFRGKGAVWEIYNEPNIGFWKPKPDVDAYAKLAVAVGKTIRSVAPDELYVGPATSEVDLHFLDACFKAGCLEYWDAVSVHPYRHQAPETAAAEYRATRTLIARYAPKDAAGIPRAVPILAGEWGYSSGGWGDGYDEARQALFLPRAWLTNLANDIPLSIWYDWHDDGTEPTEGEHHFGTVRHEYRAGQAEVFEPKPAFRSARTFATQLRGLAFRKRLVTSDPTDQVLLFADGDALRDELRIVAWTLSAKPHPTVIPASSGAFRAVDHLGIDRTVQDADAAGLTLVLDDAPLYLRPVAPNDLLRVAAAIERLPLEYRAHAPSRLSPHLRVANPLDREFAATARLDGIDATVTVAAGAQGELTLARDVSERRDAMLTVSWSIAGIGTWSEESAVVVDDPLALEMLPAVRRGSESVLPMRLLNPAGEAFSGSVSLVGSDGILSSGSALFTFAAGETAKTVALPLAATPGATFRVGVEVREGESRVLSVPVHRFASFDDFSRYDAASLPAAYAVKADGDPKVGSRLGLAPALVNDALVTGGALAIDYRFEPGWKFLRLVRTTDGAAHPEPEEEPSALGMWVRGDGSGNIARMRYIDATGQTFQPSAPPMDWKDWRFLTFPLDGSGGHWGGANDGVIHHPLRIDTLFLLDHAVMGEPTQGTITIAEPILIF